MHIILFSNTLAVELSKMSCKRIFLLYFLLLLLLLLLFIIMARNLLLYKLFHIIKVGRCRCFLSVLQKKKKRRKRMLFVNVVDNILMTYDIRCFFLLLVTFSFLFSCFFFLFSSEDKGWEIRFSLGTTRAYSEHVAKSWYIAPYTRLVLTSRHSRVVVATHNKYSWLISVIIIIRTYIQEYLTLSFSFLLLRYTTVDR